MTQRPFRLSTLKIPLNRIAMKSSHLISLLLWNPFAENHVHVGLFGEPMAQDFPLPFRMHKSPIISSNQLRNHLGHFHHGNVFTDACPRTSAKLAIVSQQSRGRLSHASNKTLKEDTYSNHATLHLFELIWRRVNPALRSIHIGIFSKYGLVTMKNYRVLAFDSCNTKLGKLLAPCV